jgi:hypothetical protein
MSNFYIYIHRKLKTNEIFYIGKGCKNRAWDRSGRNNIWHNIVKKHGYKVEILLKNLSEEESLIQERLGQMELEPKANIAKCGYKGGLFGRNHTEKTKQKIRKKRYVQDCPRTGKKHSKETKEKMSQKRKGISAKHLSKKVKCLNTGDVFESTQEAAKKLGIHQSKISLVCRYKRNHTKGYIFRYL